MTRCREQGGQLPRYKGAGATLAGHKLRIHYAAVGQTPTWRTVDPIGLETVRVQGLPARHQVRRRPHPPALPDPGRTGGDQVTVLVRVDPAPRGDLVGTSPAVHTEQTDTDGWPRLEVTFHDPRHAERAPWRLGANAEALPHAAAHLPARPRRRDRRPLRTAIPRPVAENYGLARYASPAAVRPLPARYRPVGLSAVAGNPNHAYRSTNGSRSSMRVAPRTNATCSASDG